MSKLDQEAKLLAIDLLKKQGKDYNDWLNEQHQKIINSNYKLIRNLLDENGELTNSNEIKIV